MQRFHDVTLPVFEGMVVYPGDQPLRFRRTHTIERDGYNWSELHAGTHLGTHLDAPVHFIEGGGTLDDAPLELLLGEVTVVETAAPMIDAALLATLKLDDWRAIFFKTRNQPLNELDRFCEEFVCLTPDAARFLVERGTRLVGIDYRSIEAFDAHDYPVHKTLLRTGAFILEGLYLNEVPAGRYRLHCLPLKLRAADGGPARVVLERLPEHARD